MAATSTNTKACRLERAGRLLYGYKSWQSPRAQAMRIWQSAISRMLSGDRAVTADVEAKMAAAIDKEVNRMCKAAKALREIRKEIT